MDGRRVNCLEATRVRSMTRASRLAVPRHRIDDALVRIAGATIIVRPASGVSVNDAKVFQRRESAECAADKLGQRSRRGFDDGFTTDRPWTQPASVNDESRDLFDALTTLQIAEHERSRLTHPARISFHYL